MRNIVEDFYVDDFSWSFNMVVLCIPVPSSLSIVKNSSEMIQF